MCFVFIWEQTATCATYSINWLVFITEMKSIYSAVRTGSLNKSVCASSLKVYCACYYCGALSGRSICLPKNLGGKVHGELFLNDLQKLLGIVPFAVPARFVHETSGKIYPSTARYTYYKWIRTPEPLAWPHVRRKSFSSGAKTDNPTVTAVTVRPAAVVRDSCTFSGC